MKKANGTEQRKELLKRYVRIMSREASFGLSNNGPVTVVGWHYFTYLYRCVIFDCACLQILHLAHNKDLIANKVHSIIDKFAERGLRSLAVARQASSSKARGMHFLLWLPTMLKPLKEAIFRIWSCQSSYVQEVPEKSKDSLGGPWEFLGLLPLFDPPRHDSAETIREALNLGVNVKMITGMKL